MLVWKNRKQISFLQNNPMCYGQDVILGIHLENCLVFLLNSLMLQCRFDALLPLVAVWLSDIVMWWASALGDLMPVRV